MRITCLTKDGELIKENLKDFNRYDLIKVATILNPKGDFINQLNQNNLYYEIVSLNDIDCCIIHKDLHFFKKPVISDSPTSDAIYLARSKNKMDGLLLQYLPQNSSTSKHSHKGKEETFYNLEGSCFLEVDGKNIFLEQTIHKIGPNKIHQVKTNDAFSITLLKILGDPKGLSMDDHHYVQ